MEKIEIDLTEQQYFDLAAGALVEGVSIEDFMRLSARSRIPRKPVLVSSVPGFPFFLNYQSA